MIKVSVIIPCYNVERHLENCMQTLLKQTLQELEFIFVDDGSTKDNTPAILDSFIGRDPRVRVIHQPNKGLGGARNTGIGAAAGEYIGFLDADDTVSENFFEVLCNAAQKYDADIAWTDLLRCSKGEAVRYKVHFTEESVIDRKEDIPLLRTANHVMNKIYRRTLFADGSLLFRERRFYEDIFFTVPILYAANKIVMTPGATYYYDSVPNSITRRKQDAKLQQDRYEALLFLRNFLAEKGIKVPRWLRQIRKRNWCIGRFSVLKIKDCGRYDVVKLFDVLPVWLIFH